ncbi:hypothetical protein [Sagittula stellata]|uniref:Uncharacterized protein n=1 Tax=Sagittula stellata (strain ATCC 700073 / DSM 11524 / E-37) TaxID=388399 RepID=A3K4M2_SAGS3|nr:hypothetical protein [Sagittula stellata]EBA07921.1 hypothetical protein SSE37_01670 [Sagittula stellata E-37]
MKLKLTTPCAYLTALFFGAAATPGLTQDEPLYRGVKDGVVSGYPIDFSHCAGLTEFGLANNSVLKEDRNFTRYALRLHSGHELSVRRTYWSQISNRGDTRDDVRSVVEMVVYEEGSLQPIPLIQARRGRGFSYLPVCAEEPMVPTRPDQYPSAAFGLGINADKKDELRSFLGGGKPLYLAGRLRLPEGEQLTFSQLWRNTRAALETQRLGLPFDVTLTVLGQKADSEPGIGIVEWTVRDEQSRFATPVDFNRCLGATGPEPVTTDNMYSVIDLGFRIDPDTIQFWEDDGEPTAFMPLNLVLRSGMPPFLATDVVRVSDDAGGQQTYMPICIGDRPLPTESPELAKKRPFNIGAEKLAAYRKDNPIVTLKSGNLEALTPDDIAPSIVTVRKTDDKTEDAILIEAWAGGSLDSWIALMLRQAQEPGFEAKVPKPLFLDFPTFPESLDIAFAETYNIEVATNAVTEAAGGGQISPEPTGTAPTERDTDDTPGRSETVVETTVETLTAGTDTGVMDTAVADTDVTDAVTGDTQLGAETEEPEPPTPAAPVREDEYILIANDEATRTLLADLGDRLGLAGDDFQPCQRKPETEAIYPDGFFVFDCTNAKKPPFLRISSPQASFQKITLTQNALQISAEDLVFSQGNRLQLQIARPSAPSALAVTPAPFSFRVLENATLAAPVLPFPVDLVVSSSSAEALDEITEKCSAGPSDGFRTGCIIYPVPDAIKDPRRINGCGVVIDLKRVPTTHGCIVPPSANAPRVTYFLDGHPDQPLSLTSAEMVYLIEHSSDAERRPVKSPDIIISQLTIDRSQVQLTGRGMTADVYEAANCGGAPSQQIAVPTETGTVALKGDISLPVVMQIHSSDGAQTRCLKVEAASRDTAFIQLEEKDLRKAMSVILLRQDEFFGNSAQRFRAMEELVTGIALRRGLHRLLVYKMTSQDEIGEPLFDGSKYVAGDQQAAFDLAGVQSDLIFQQRSTNNVVSDLAQFQTTYEELSPESIYIFASSEAADFFTANSQVPGLWVAQGTGFYIFTDGKCEAWRAEVGATRCFDLKNAGNDPNFVDASLADIPRGD